jgi:hypothetical protein
MSEQHLVECLFELLSQFGAYPAGVVPSRWANSGNSVFPLAAPGYGAHMGGARCLRCRLVA